MFFSNLSEYSKAMVRKAYYAQHSAFLSDETAQQLSDDSVKILLRKGELLRRQDEVKSNLSAGAGILLFVGAIVGFIALTNVNNSEDTSTSNSNSSSNTSSLDNSSDTDYYPYSSNGDTEAEDCNPNYTGCVPNTDYDLDCSDIGEEVEVIGSDVYNLDRDGDGYGCESY